MLTLNPRILLPLLYSFSFDVTKAYTLTYTLSLSLSLFLSSPALLRFSVYTLNLQLILSRETRT